MRPILFSLVLLTFLSLNSFSDSISVSGSVSGEWSADTVKVTGDLLLEEGSSLLIQPGIRVEFQGSYSFYIGGSIQAMGNANARIVFDVADTTRFSIDTIPDGGWNGIQFYYTAASVDSSIFHYCDFRHGKAVSADTLENHGGAICVRNFDKVRISRCRFLENFAILNGGAIYLSTADIAIIDNEFENNSAGLSVSPWGYGGAICADDSDPLVRDNYFAFNASTGVGGAVAIRFHDARVHNNIFHSNYSALGGAIGYLHYYTYAHSQCNNLIYDNIAEFFGGGIACLDAGPTIVNNTLSGNSSSYGGAFYVKDSIVPNVYNCILWGNTAAVGPEVYLWDAYASANFYHCDVQGGPELFGGSGGGAGYVGEYLDNLDMDPQFEYLPDHDYHLSLTSPLQNMGTPDTTGFNIPATDLDGVPRIDIHAQIIDMGCYELQWIGVDPADHGNRTHDLIIYPNPAKELVTVESSSKINKIEIFDMTGKTVLIDYPASEKTNLQIKDLMHGIYMLNVFTDYGTSTKKIVVKEH